jgi:hypothetical protein
VAFLAAQAVVHRVAGRLEDALKAAEGALEGGAGLGAIFPGVKLAFATGADAALGLGDLARVNELLALPAGLGAGQTTPLWAAQESRVKARLTAQQGGSEETDEAFRRAAGVFRDAGVPFWLAVTLLEHGEWLSEAGRGEDAESMASEAVVIFQRLGATPWAERATAVSGSALKA